MELDVEASPHAAQPWFVRQLQRQKVTAAVANNLGAGRIQLLSRWWRSRSGEE
jgi:hypothetical protein